MKPAIYFLAAVSAITSGCATSTAEGRNASRRPTVFAGTRLNMAAIREDYARLSTYEKYGISAPENPVFDMPFSIVADTLLFPMDAWYWAGDKVGMKRPPWAGILAGELKGNSTGSADSP